MKRVLEDRGGEDLIPGLLEELVIAHVVSRLPWYVRPVCRAISKHWRACIDSCKAQPELSVQTRKYQLPLLKGHLLICIDLDFQMFITRDSSDADEQRVPYDEGRDWTYQINHREWRKLPSLQDLLVLQRRPSRTLPMIIARSGMVYVWSNKEPNVVLKMDLGGGDWTWSKISIPPHFEDAKAIDFKGKIYIPQVSTGESTQKKVLVYNMKTDQCERVEPWNCDNLRVLLKESSCSTSHVEEELYSLVEHGSKVAVLVYDTHRNSWRILAEIPFPESDRSTVSDFDLSNRKCFEPASKMGVNMMWVRQDREEVCWFNLSQKAWVTFNCNPQHECLDKIWFEHGWLYGIFAFDDGLEYQEVEVIGLTRKLMVGRLCVASRSVVWEEIHEIQGRFKDHDYFPSVPYFFWLATD